MKRLMVQDAFVGEANPNQEGLAVWGDGDEAAVLRIHGGQLVLLVPPGTPEDQLFDAAQFLTFELTLEGGRTLNFGAQADTEGTYLLAGRATPAYIGDEAVGDLSTIWSHRP